jgi:hypothetical protein
MVTYREIGSRSEKVAKKGRNRRAYSARMGGCPTRADTTQSHPQTAPCTPDSTTWSARKLSQSAAQMPRAETDRSCPRAATPSPTGFTFCISFVSRPVLTASPGTYSVFHSDDQQILRPERKLRPGAAVTSGSPSPPASPSSPALKFGDVSIDRDTPVPSSWHDPWKCYSRSFGASHSTRPRTNNATQSSQRATAARP